MREQQKRRIYNLVMTQLAKELNEKSKAQKDALNEGIDFDEFSREVSYNPSHENNVDTSIINNPTLDTEIVPNIEVWSIFKRKKGMRGDGNPLIYAMKNERNWHFKSGRDKKAIERQFNLIADKFISKHPFGITIIVPSGSYLNQYIANVLLSKNRNAQLIEGAIRKLTTDEVREIAWDRKSVFYQTYHERYHDFQGAYQMLNDYLEEMDKQRRGYFTRHFILNNEMRDTLDFTFKVSEDVYAKYANKINDQDVLIIDDTISRGQSVKEACKVIQESYAPKSITVLTLMSKLYDE